MSLTKRITGSRRKRRKQILKEEEEDVNVSLEFTIIKCSQSLNKHTDFLGALLSEHSVSPVAELILVHTQCRWWQMMTNIWHPQRRVSTFCKLNVHSFWYNFFYVKVCLDMFTKDFVLSIKHWLDLFAFSSTHKRHWHLTRLLNGHRLSLFFSPMGNQSPKR